MTCFLPSPLGEGPGVRSRGQPGRDSAQTFETPPQGEEEDHPPTMPALRPSTPAPSRAEIPFPRGNETFPPLRIAPRPLRIPFPRGNEAFPLCRVMRRPGNGSFPPADEAFPPFRVTRSSGNEPFPPFRGTQSQGKEGNNILDSPEGGVP